MQQMRAPQLGMHWLKKIVEHCLVAKISLRGETQQMILLRAASRSSLVSVI